MNPQECNTPESEPCVPERLSRLSVWAMAAMLIVIAAPLIYGAYKAVFG